MKTACKTALDAYMKPFKIVRQVLVIYESCLNLVYSDRVVGKRSFVPES